MKNYIIFAVTLLCACTEATKAPEPVLKDSISVPIPKDSVLQVRETETVIHQDRKQNFDDSIKLLSVWVETFYRITKPSAPWDDDFREQIIYAVFNDSTGDCVAEKLQVRKDTLAEDGSKVFRYFVRYDEISTMYSIDTLKSTLTYLSKDFVTGKWKREPITTEWQIISDSSRAQGLEPYDTVFPVKREGIRRIMKFMQKPVRKD